MFVHPPGASPAFVHCPLHGAGVQPSPLPSSSPCLAPVGGGSIVSGDQGPAFLDAKTGQGWEAWGCPGNRPAATPPPPRLPELLGVGQEVQGPLKGHGTGRGDEGGRESRLSSQLIC